MHSSTPITPAYKTLSKAKLSILQDIQPPEHLQLDYWPNVGKHRELKYKRGQHKQSKHCDQLAKVTQLTSSLYTSQLHQYQHFVFRSKMPGPQVEKKISTRRGNCNSMKRVTGIPERKTIGITICSFPSNRIIRAAQKATIMVAMEMKSVERPMISFVGKDLRKSCSA